MASEAARRRANKRNYTKTGRVKSVPKRPVAPTSISVPTASGRRTVRDPKAIARIVAATPKRSVLPQVGPSAWSASTALSSGQQREADLLGAELARYLNRRAGEQGVLGGGTGKRLVTAAEIGSLAIPGVGAAGAVGRGAVSAARVVSAGSKASRMARTAERVSAAAKRAEKPAIEVGKKTSVRARVPKETRDQVRLWDRRSVDRVARKSKRRSVTDDDAVRVMRKPGMVRRASWKARSHVARNKGRYGVAAGTAGLVGGTPLVVREKPEPAFVEPRSGKRRGLVPRRVAMLPGQGGSAEVLYGPLTDRKGGRVRSYMGRRTFGAPPVKHFEAQAAKGKLRFTKSGRLATVGQLKARDEFRKALAVYERAAKKTKGGRQKALRSAGLSAEQAQVLSTVLNQGRKLGASPKEMLSAIETAIRESNISNPTVATDHDSLGWRQERQMYYDNPTNVKASARRYFQETAQAGRGVGMTAGQLAQSVQRSAYPERYDQVESQARSLLAAFGRGDSKPIPKRVQARYADADVRAAKLGVPTGKVDSKFAGALKAPVGTVKGGFAYPLAVRGKIGSTASDHAARPFGNWMSDNAVDILVPIGTPVRAVTDAVVSRVSGSAPNHAANPAGYTVYLKDKSGQEYAYMHLDGYRVKAGQRVRAGERLGRSGAANGVAHLHFATLKGDPEGSLKGEPGAAKARFVNFSKKGAGTSSSRWLIPDSNTRLKFQTPFGRALVKLAKASGEPIRFQSGSRTTAEQQQLYNDYIAGRGNLAAKPGTSNHEFGAAADVTLTAKQRELASQFGLGFPVSGEPWHIELVGDAANRIVGGLSSGAGGGGAIWSGSGTLTGQGASGGSGRRQQSEGGEGGGSSYTSSLLPQEYVDLVMNAGSGDNGVLDEFLDAPRKQRKRRRS